MVGYNSITQEAGNFLLWKNPGDQYLDSFKFKDMTVHWGLSPENKVRIFRLDYPEKSWSKSDVEQIAIESVDCPHCREGHAVSDPQAMQGFNNPTWLYKKQTVFGEDMSLQMPKIKMPESITSFADSFAGPSFSKNVLPQAYAKIPQALTALVGTALGKKLLDAAIGVAGLGVTYAYRGQLSNRAVDEFNSLFGNFLASVADVSPEKKFAIDADLLKIRDALSFGDPLAAVKAFFQDPQQIAGNFGLSGFDFTKFGLPQLPALPALSFGFPTLPGVNLPGQIAGANGLPLPAGSPQAAFGTSPVEAINVPSPLRPPYRLNSQWG